jgi:hypothetical protein
VSADRRTYRPRILDAAALVSLVDGNLRVLSMLDDAYVGRAFVLMPAVAIAEAEAGIQVGGRMWEPFFRISGTETLELTGNSALEAARLMDSLPLMLAQVVHEAQTMEALVVTHTPEAYDGYDVELMPV